jgi:hypothetical protein
MRWLMILLLVSLVALLVAAAGMARHVWQQHKKLPQEPSVDSGTFPAPALNQRPGSIKEPVRKKKI